jgi:hypothetical protein
MRKAGIARWIARATIVLGPAVYVGACSFNSQQGKEAMAQVRNGDSEERVVALFGPPTSREPQGAGYPRYVNDRCLDPCVERLWFQNSLSIVDEAWFVALDKNRRVLRAAHLISP